MPVITGSDLIDREGLIPVLVAAIAASEVILVFLNLAIGVLLEAIVLGVIVWLQAVRADDRDGRAMVPLALVPVLRLLSLTMPLPGVPPAYWPALAGGPLAIAGIFAARSAGLSLATVGLRRSSWPGQVGVALLGLPFGLIVYGLAKPELPLGAGAEAGPLLPALVVMVFIGVTEEWIFRGVIQGGLRLAYPRSGVVIVAILYGTSYLATLSFPYAVAMTAVGLGYGLIVERTGSIVGVSTSHAILAVGALLIWPALLGAP